MKLPRDLAAADLERALHRAFGYQFTRQSGSHRRLTTQKGGEHHLTIPAHDPLKPGTLRAILAEVAAHHRLTVEDLLRQLEL
ncbi:MAG: type II toxin-antitoxin system HicA family toxin [Verrucomicrobiales bacterium]|nr:type II toxin-antitoxin system HicA family toxin [Verrucomicrobiales bacterium]